MSGALVYLELQSRANALRGWLRRLREPRYALGSLVMLAYFGFFVFRPLWSSDGALHQAHVEIGGLLVGDFTLVLVFLFLAWAWTFGSERAALAFSEAEVAWLFPAPFERRTLVHFRLLKAQIVIVFGALLYAALAAGAGKSYGQRAIGIWVVLSFSNLHAVAGAFTRERLLACGLGVKRRRAVLSALLLVLLALTWASRPAPAAASASSLPALGFGRDFGAMLATPPLAWTLAPLYWVFAPLRAASVSEMFAALGPALGLLGAHYLWAMRAMVGFEEASAALAAKRAARIRAMASGRGLLASRDATVRPDAFALAPRGRAEVAFLWQRWIAAGSWLFPRSLLMLAALPIAAALALSVVPGWHGALRPASAVATAAALYGLLLGPALARGSLATLFERIELAKSYPLRGWQVVLGELMLPIALLSAFELTSITVAALCAGALLGWPQLALAGWLGAASLTPPLVAVMFGAQLGLQLALPAWFHPSQPHARLEQGGQRLLFTFFSMLVFLVALIPAGIPALLIGAGAWVLTESAVLGGAVAAPIAAIVLLGELALLVRWLGARYERLDLTRDLAR